MRSRIAAATRLLILLVLEGAAIPALLATASPAEGIDWRDLGSWLITAAPEDAVVAVVRLVALVLAVWLLATTLLYLVARLTAVPALVRGMRWATLPVVRKVVDAALAASIVGGAVVGTHPAGAQVPAPPPIVVQLDTTTTSRPAHLYVPVPAGDRGATTTTVSIAPNITRPSPTTATPPARPAPTARTAAAPAATPAHHTVVAGENLWTIAEAELSRQTGRVTDDLAEAEIRDYWLTVIDANHHRLLSGDPNLIYPGESILCPPPT